MKYHIYTLTNPITNMVFYVGQTSGPLKERLYSHVLKSNAKKTATHKLIQGIKAAGYNPIIEEIESCDILPNGRGREFYENYWIHQFIAWGFEMTNDRISSKSMASNGGDDLVINWLIEHDLILIQPLEQKAGIPYGSLSKAIRGVRALPKKYHKPLTDVLKKYGFK